MKVKLEEIKVKYTLKNKEQCIRLKGLFIEKCTMTDINPFKYYHTMKVTISENVNFGDLARWLIIDFMQTYSKNYEFFVKEYERLDTIYDCFYI